MNLRAKPGDRLVVPSGLPGGRDRHAKILDVRGPDWGPPYLVQWAADGSIEVMVPGPEAWVDHFSQLPPRRAAA